MMLRMLCTSAAVVAGVMMCEGSVWANILEDTNTTGAIAATPVENTAADAAAAAATAATPVDTRTEAEKLLDAYKNGQVASSCENSTSLSCATTTMTDAQTCVIYKTRTTLNDAWSISKQACSDTTVDGNDTDSSSDTGSGSGSTSLQDMLKDAAVRQALGNIKTGNPQVDSLLGSLAGGNAQGALSSAMSAMGDFGGGNGYSGALTDEMCYLKSCRNPDKCASGENRGKKSTTVASTSNVRSAYEKTPVTDSEAAATQGVICIKSCPDKQDGICRADVQFMARGITSEADKAKYVGRQVGATTECAALTQDLTNVGHTSTWRKGPAVTGCDDLPVGTAISTFNFQGDSRYGEKADGSGGTSGQSHTGIYLGRDCKKGVHILHQWNSAGAARASWIPWDAWNGHTGEAGTKYYAISH